MNLEERLDYHFQDKALLKEALSHPSLSSEIRPAPPDNQRLEYLGDAVVELAISNHLYHRFPDLKEGTLTKLRASVVSRPALAHAARDISLGEELLMSNGEAGSGGRLRDSNLADAFESIAGAIYLDGGLEAATKVILQLLAPQLETLNPSKARGNFKGELQEILQKLSQDSPVYEVLSEDGPPHERVFNCAVLWKDKRLGQGSGSSKKLAESEAARTALDLKLWNTAGRD
ncbi:MAG: ribonuclease III [Akkermansiaceae bacterium]